MLTESLPTTLDVRKAAVRGTHANSILKPLDLKRFRSMLGGDEGSIAVEMTFSRDEENRYLIRVTIEAEIVVTCQRCLEAMPEHLSCVSTLAVLWTDEEAVHLPSHLDPLLVGDNACRLWEVVEDELILALRPFSYHDTEDCKTKIAAFQEPVPQPGSARGKPNPFNVLGRLKPGSKQ